jgi:DNA-binding transcriptional MerR regulator
MGAMADQTWSEEAGEARHNIKAVVQQTGVPADTVRAWERRYGLPRPPRTATGRRLYSERDIATIRWLRARTDEGMTISQAVQQLKARGDDPPALSAAVGGARSREPRAGAAPARELLAALLAFDEQGAGTIVEEAFALYRVEEVCLGLFAPVLVALGERRGRHGATTVQERVATNFVRQRLAALLWAYAPPVARGLIVAACAPDEWHELDLLILSVFLVRRAWRVVFLGADLPTPGLLEAVAQLRPALVCLSATGTHAAQMLAAAAAALADLSSPDAPRPLVAFGGPPFNADPALRARVPGHWLGADTREAVARVEELLSPASAPV